jgi:octopine/nopaline transport system permease protein/arginine/ornithine transport system permease protein
MDFSIVWQYLPKLFAGAWVTLWITVISLAIGLAFAIPLALARLSKNPIIYSPAYLFVLYFRGTPLLVQIFLIYYGSGQFRNELTDLGLWGFFRDPWFCAILALVLNTAAYSAEIFRGAISAVPRNDIEAGRSCGMSGLLLFRRITLPKAFRIGLPAYGNEVIFLLQATSLVSTITILDLTGISRQLISKTFAVYEFYLTAAAMYLVMTYALVYLFRMWEKRMSGHLQARAVTTPR